MSKSKAEVSVEFYDDIGDPDPPNNHRVEIVIGDVTFVPYYLPNRGCMTKREANNLRRRVKRALVNYG